MKVTEIPVAGYEKVVRGIDPTSGLHALIAVHDTTLGPAVGGTRMLPYADEQQALTDVLRLAQGMTYKSAVAETGLGGGKSVILGDPARKTPELFRALGRLVNTLEGTYLAAEDMNVSPDDLRHAHETTRWITGLPDRSGNPSPLTALGVFAGIGATLEQVHGSADYSGRVVVIQGVGSVGSVLGTLLTEAGAHVVACDLDAERARRLAAQHGWDVVGNDEWMDVECDVQAPCARGATINDETIPRLRCRAVAGAANNQLAEPRHGDALAARGILYAPDYVINAGGIINIAVELSPEGYRLEEARRRARGIADMLRRVFTMAREQELTPAAAADRLARERLAAGRTLRAS